MCRRGTFPPTLGNCKNMNRAEKRRQQKQVKRRQRKIPPKRRALLLRPSPWSGRLGETLLNSLGMPELVADNPQHYHDLAVSLANDLPRLEQLHAQLRDTVVASPLCDGAAFVNKQEQAYWKIWQG